MKKKLLIPAGLLVLSLIGLASCGHQHSYKTEWAGDATHHWHECADESCKEVSEKGEHTGGTATETEKAVCEVCNVEYGSLKNHEHAFTVSKVDAKYLASEADCENAATYYKSCACGEKGSDTFVDGEPLGHDTSIVEASEASPLKNGNIEHYACSRCDGVFQDADAKTKLDDITISSWTSLNDVEEPTVVEADGSAKFVGLNASSYIDNFIVDANGNDIAGLYNSETANNEFTLEAEFTSNGTFAMILFANEDTKTVYNSESLDYGIAVKLGFFIRFDANDADANVKLQAALGNGASGKEASTGIKASAKASSLSFDGATKNNVKITMERYSEDKLIMQIKVNDELLSFTKSDGKTVDVVGFNFRTEWDRTKGSNDEGIGKSYYKDEKAYPTIACSRGLSALEGYGNGLAIAPIGYVDRNDSTGTKEDYPSGKVASDSDVAVEVVLSKLALTKTADSSSVHFHSYSEVVADEYIATEATCTEPASYNKSCSCGLTISETFKSGDPLDHDMTKEVNDKTHHWKECAREGCNYSSTKEIHSYNEGEYFVSEEGKGGHYQKCKECGKETEVVEHSGGQATETEQAKCEHCNAPYGELLTHVCVYDQLVIAEEYLVPGSNCQTNAFYYKSCECGKYGTESFDSDTLGSHIMEKHEAVKPSPFANGSIEYYYCSACNKMYKDEKGNEEVTETLAVAWKALKDVETPSSVVINGTSATFSGLASSSYISDILVDADGNDIAGAYNASSANKEHTLTLDITADGTFVIVLFADENTKKAYEDSDIVDSIAPKMGFYITFDSEKDDIAIKAAVGNGEGSAATTGNRARGGAGFFKYDGSVNTVSITTERADLGNVVITVKINDQEVIFKKTNKDGVKKCGFALLESWDGTTMGPTYSNSSKSFAPVVICAGMSETAGLGNGLAVAPVNAQGGETNTTVVISKVQYVNTEVAA